MIKENRQKYNKNKESIKRIEKLFKDYPMMDSKRRLDLLYKLTELHKANQMLKMNKLNSRAFEFQPVYKKHNRI